MAIKNIYINPGDVVYVHVVVQANMQDERPSKEVYYNQGAYSQGVKFSVKFNVNSTINIQGPPTISVHDIRRKTIIPLYL